MDSNSEPKSKLISLICKLMSLDDTDSSPLPKWDLDSKLLSITIQIISLVNSMDLASQPTPELMSLISQTISVFKSMDLDSQPKPIQQLISIIKQTISLFKSLDLSSEQKPLSKLESLITQASPLLNSLDTEWEFKSLLGQTFSLWPKRYSYLTFISLFRKTMYLEPEPKIMSLIHQIFLLVIPMNPTWNKLISLSPEVKVILEHGKFRVTGKVKRGINNKWECLPFNWMLTGEEDTHFFCNGCKGDKHEEYEKAPVEIKHPFHQKHSLQLVWSQDKTKTRECYCCEESLKQFFYYCSACDFAMNSTCLEKTPVLSIDHPKFHEHTLAHFPRHASLTCDMCGLVDSNSPIFVCLPCGFVVHQPCISLPRVIRISRHLHRVSFTSCFDHGDWFCGVCRRKIESDYGGYSCIKKGCSYVAHAKCATHKNVWDGNDLEGLPEKWKKINDGI